MLYPTISAFVLAKTGPTNNNAAAGARINGLGTFTITELGWDVRNGTHCGAGAPRFNITTSDGTTYLFILRSVLSGRA